MIFGAQYKAWWQTRRYRSRRQLILLRCVVALLSGIVASAGSIYADVVFQGRPIYYSPSSAPPRPVAIVFGAGYGPAGPSPVLLDRIRTAVNLYRLGKVQKLLLTGDNSEPNYNEPREMRTVALKLGVPGRNIVLDYAGFRTYDSLYRARSVFGVTRAILVSQEFHLPRALFIARGLGLDVVGVAADRQRYGAAAHWFSVRETFAILDAWVDTELLHPRPKYLGKPELGLAGT